MRIGPLFKWFGSKWSSSRHYPEPLSGAIWEPYAGGAGYSLNYVDRPVFLYDADEHLQKLWRWLIEEAKPADILDIPLNMPIGLDIRRLGLSEGQSLLLKNWQRTNNVGNCWTISPWGSKPGQWTERTRARVAEEIGAIKHWRFGAEPELPEGTTWFIDPPYQFNYRYSRTLPKFDYDELVRTVNAAPSTDKVIVCEARDPKTGEKPSYLPFEDSHESVTSRRKKTQSHHSKELLFVRSPLYCL